MSKTLGQRPIGIYFTPLYMRYLLWQLRFGDSANMTNREKISLLFFVLMASFYPEIINIDPSKGVVSSVYGVAMIIVALVFMDGEKK